ncbi:MAG TPA: hypothetical protein VF659_07885 [Pyrinomonadaceae bacterium]|jgi:hypothetical protein
MMPPSGQCPICSKYNTYIPDAEPPKLTRPATRPAAPPRTRARTPAPGAEKVQTTGKKKKPVEQERAGKPGGKAKPKWNWWAAIIGFLLTTGYGVNQLGLERNAALVLGGVAGIISGYYYAQIIVIGIIVFIAHALLNKQ